MRRAANRAAATLCAVLAGCAGGPRAPDWQVEAHGAIERYQQAFLTGASRAAEAEFARARAALSATGDATQVARAELVRCALEAASLGPAPCPGFEALRADAAAPEAAYADYLAGQPLPAARAALLPPAHRALATQAADADSIARIEDPLSRLVAAGVALRAGRATPGMIAAAEATASRQGWRRPLLAWLGVQARRAEAAGDLDAAQRLRRRIALAAGAP
ncbi:hypothetical protein ACT80S_13340 [Ramlibacter sp. MAHUQ-53]|uniref:hypothetical protein n=1 Tax=unclassified Ramlibacter TaxID=2617605 RepID=UPI003625120A